MSDWNVKCAVTTPSLSAVRTVSVAICCPCRELQLFVFIYLIIYYNEVTVLSIMPCYTTASATSPVVLHVYYKLKLKFFLHCNDCFNSVNVISI